jgi:erythromycin esterase
MKFPYIFLFVIALSAKTQDKNLELYVRQQVKDMGDVRTGNVNFGFLDSVLNKTRIVMLGESSHGTEEYSLLKKQLIQYLHEKLGFSVVLFESPMTNCSYLNLATDTNYAELVKYSIQSVWHTETVRQLFCYIKRSNIQFAGFDPQYIYSSYPALVYKEAFKDHPQLLGRLLQLEDRIAGTIKYPSRYIALKDSFARAYADLAVSLQHEQSSPFQQWVRQTLVTNTGYYARITKGDQRDADMARNIIWLAENLYKNEKIIIWAHNTHIDKNATSPKRNMGKLLAGHFKDQLYGIGLYMISGTTAENDRDIFTIKPPPPGSIEMLISKAAFKTSFLSTNNNLFDRPVTTLHWGRAVQKMNLYKSFDAMILIDGVSAPAYLQ